LPEIPGDVPRLYLHPRKNSPYNRPLPYPGWHPTLPVL